MKLLATKFVKPIQKPLLKLRALFPSTLPVGMTEFENYYQEIIQTFDIPDLPSYKNAIATQIMHLHPLETCKSKLYFAKCIKKAQANQTAYEVIDQFRQLEKAKDAKPTEPPPAP